MAKRTPKKKTPKQVETLTHDETSRKNIPPPCRSSCCDAGSVLAKPSADDWTIGSDAIELVENCPPTDVRKFCFHEFVEAILAG